MNSPATGDATDEPDRYHPFSTSAEQPAAQSNRETPEAVTPPAFRTADHDRETRPL